MKRLLFYFFVLLLAAWIGLKVQADAGYVLVVYRNLSIETTLWFAVAALVVGFLLFYLFLRFVHNSRILPGRLMRWWYKRSEQKAVHLTNVGLMKLIEQDYNSAERCLSKSAEKNPDPFVNYLAAAWIAQKQEAYKRRDSYLNKAHSTMPDAELAVGILQVRMQIRSKQWEQALATLKYLQGLKPHHKTVLRCLQQVYCELGDWQSLLELLPQLKKKAAYSAEEYYLICEKVYLGVMSASAAKQGKKAVDKAWHELPRSMQENPKLLAFYVDFLLKDKRSAEAEELLRKVLNKVWLPEILPLYAFTSGEKAATQLAAAERWLKSHPENVELLMCLGQICKKQALWGKARRYLEQVVALSPSASAYLQLGEIMEKYEGIEQNKAKEFYKQGIIKLMR
ncbi:MAG: heme biosynthesis HemY N-terminal domain-containing protein [Gammaproteobacteria bacterium]